jgi:hypothetical protein
MVTTYVKMTIASKAATERELKGCVELISQGTNL